MYDKIKMPLLQESGVALQFSKIKWPDDTLWPVFIKIIITYERTHHLPGTSEKEELQRLIKSVVLISM